jgi:hypothetical protein
MVIERRYKVFNANAANKKASVYYDIVRWNADQSKFIREFKSAASPNSQGVLTHSECKELLLTSEWELPNPEDA